MKPHRHMRFLRLGDWPIFYKVLLGVVSVVMLALSVTTVVNVGVLQSELREKIGTKVEIKMTTVASGQVIIHFYSKDDLKALIEHLT